MKSAIISICIVSWLLTGCTLDTKWKACYDGVCIEGTIPGRPDAPIQVTTSGKEVKPVQ